MSVPLPTFDVGARSRESDSRLMLRAMIAGVLLLTLSASAADAQTPRGHLVRSERPQGPPPHPAVARIIVQEKDSVSYGSGTLIDVRENVGLVVTNWHVVTDAAGPISVLFPDGFQSPARVLKADKDWDLAALAIWKPSAQPVPLATTAPLPGEPLAIAGYGSGDWRLVTGRCTQYVAPGENLPYEMVEMSAEARQGDSGGPIFNRQGELAGVLFGASRGTTSGSYAGRVRQFLTPIIAAESAGTTEAAANSSPGQLATTGQGQPAVPNASEREHMTGPLPTKKEQPGQPIGEPTISHARQSAAPETTANVDPVPQPLANLPPDNSLAPRDTAINAAGDDPRLSARGVGSGLTGVDLRAGAEQGFTYAPLPPRGGRASGSWSLPAVVGTSGQSGGDIWQSVWRQAAGTTPWDQGKSILAALGLLTIAYRMWGRDSSSRDED